MQLGEWSNGIGKHIIKIEDGKNVVVNFRGNVVRFYQHWAGGRGSICPGREVCSLCNSPNDDDKKATGRFRINCILKDDKSAAMIFEGGKRVYEQLLQINKDIPLEKAWIRIARIGTKQDTQFMLTVLPGENGMIKAAEEKAIITVPLHDLSLNKSEDDEEVVAEPGSDG